MRRLALLLVLLAAPLGAATYTLQPSHLVYEGYFTLPSAVSGTYAMTYVGDCMSESDPSSSTYPGCLLIATRDKTVCGDGSTPPCTDSNSEGQPGDVTLVDIVAPTGTGTYEAASVKSSWRVVGTDPWDAGWQIGVKDDEFDFYYDDANNRLVWNYYNEYGNQPADTDLVWGYTDFTGTTPTPSGDMYRWTIQADSDTTTTDPFRATKFLYNVKRIPSAIATDYFSGDEMLLGPGKGTGSRGSSAGPSMAVRPWTFPTDTDGWDGVTPISYFHSATGYTRWYADTAFRGTDDRNWGFSDSCPNNLMVRVVDGADDYEAMLTLCGRAVVNTDIYPANDPNAAPDEGTGYSGMTYYNQCAGGYEGCGGVVQGTYNWPDPTIVPALWYGVETYDVSNAVQVNPSMEDYCPEDVCFPDSTGIDDPDLGLRDKQRMPSDSQMQSMCQHGTGPNGGLKRQSVWFFWELAELGDMYAGISGYGPEEYQPYEEKVYYVDPDNDGYNEYDSCVQVKRLTASVAYDPTNQLIYVLRRADSKGSRPYSMTTDMAVDVWSFNVGGGAAPSVVGDSSIDGGGVDGGGIQ